METKPGNAKIISEIFLSLARICLKTALLGLLALQVSVNSLFLSSGSKIQQLLRFA